MCSSDLTIADEQRLRAAYVEGIGQSKYLEEIDERPDDEKPGPIDKEATSVGAYVSKATGGAGPSANTKTVAGVSPTSKADAKAEASSHI